MKRIDGRRPNQIRPVVIHPHYVSAPAGSALIEMGQTRVLCAASVEEGVPRWMREQKKPGGWVTAEYSMLPYASSPRKQREVVRGFPEGRTQEIQRLIGRSLRAVTNMEKLGARTVWVDCDVLQADGGTRTAAVTGAYVALALALQKLQAGGMLAESPLTAAVAAVSVGVVEGEALLDLCYVEDVAATVDMNVVMTDRGEFVEVQGTGEQAPFTTQELSRLLKLAEKGTTELFRAQQQALH
ncbi:MAG: ribonuclease PH [Verrucomicrobia bacterium]|nr:ribonuclease PH [Verrucomicrobiota bacterium]